MKNYEQTLTNVIANLNLILRQASAQEAFSS